MNTTYKLIKDDEGTLWVTVEPVMQDLAQALAFLETLPTDGLSTQGAAELDLKILSTAALYQFFGALKTEYELSELKDNMQ